MRRRRGDFDGLTVLPLLGGGSDHGTRAWPPSSRRRTWTRRRICVSLSGATSSCRPTAPAPAAPAGCGPSGWRGG